MLLDEIIDNDNVTEQLQDALVTIEKNKDTINEIFNNVFNIANEKFETVDKDKDTVVIVLKSAMERDLCEEFYKRYLIKELEEKLNMDRKYMYLIFKIHSNNEYVSITRKRK